MTIDSLINRINKLYSWMFSRNWEKWEILIIAIVAMSVIVLVARARRKARINARHIQLYRPIIGIRLSNRAVRH